MGRSSLVKMLTLMVYSWSKMSCLLSGLGSAVTVSECAFAIRIGIPLIISPSAFLTNTWNNDNVELLCDLVVRYTFSNECLYDNDSKRVPEKVFQHEPEASGEKSFGTSFESLSYRNESENVCRTTRSHCKCIIV